MFKFSGTISDRNFLVALAIRFLGLILTYIAFPFLVYGFALAIGCTQGACGILGIMAAIFIKPFIIGIFAFSLLGISVRRMRTLNIPAWAGLALPALVLCDFTVLTVIGSSSWTGMMLGVISIGLPIGLLTAMLLGVLMAAIPKEVIALPPGHFAKQLASIAAAAGTIYLVAFFTIYGLPKIDFLGRFLIGTLPTFVLYFFALTFIYLAWQWRSRIAIGMTIVFILLLVQWSYTSWSASEAQQAELAAIDAIPTVRASGSAKAVVLEGSRAQSAEDWPPEITSRWRQFASGTLVSRRSDGGWGEWTDTRESIPLPYLQLRTGDSSAYAVDGPGWMQAGPYEMREISAEEDELVAIWYRSTFNIYTALPILTTSGWARNPSGFSFGFPVSDFIVQSLGTSP